MGKGLPKAKNAETAMIFAIGFILHLLRNYYEYVNYGTADFGGVKTSPYISNRI
jgi:hypothetical protein